MQVSKKFTDKPRTILVLKRTWHAIFFSRTKGPIMRYLWILRESFSKIGSTFFSLGKIAVLIV